MNVNPCIMGIDPGVSGAIAFFFPAAAGRVAASDVPVAGGLIDAANLAERITQMRPDFAVVEMVGARPGQGVSSMFKFGRSFGTVIGVLGALQIPTHFVGSNRWKKHFHLSADKEQSRALALRMFPQSAASFARKKDAGRAEAALLALYGAEAVPQPLLREVVAA